MYNGEPYVPDEIGIYPEDDERFGRGGLPQIGSDRLRFKKPDTEHSDNKEIFVLVVYEPGTSHRRYNSDRSYYYTSGRKIVR